MSMDAPGTANSASDLVVAGDRGVGGDHEVEVSDQGRGFAEVAQAVAVVGQIPAIGERVGVSQMQVSRILRAALDQLRDQA